MGIATTKATDRAQALMEAAIRVLGQKIDDATDPDFHGCLVVSLHITAGNLVHVKASVEQVHKMIAGRLQ